MRFLIAATAALLASAGAAYADPAAVTVTIGPKLQEKADKTYGAREIDRLAAELRGAVERGLAGASPYDGARIELVLTDAKPNRPTLKQLGDTPGLSMSSFGVGGASIEGRIVRPDGSAQPFTYRWYETDIRNAAMQSTWHDAGWAFTRLTQKLSRGEQLAER